MTPTLQSIDDLLQSLLPEGTSIYGNIEHVSGVHVPVFAAMLLDALELDLCTNAKEMDIYNSVRQIVCSESLECKIADDIKNLTSEIARDQDSRSILMRVLQNQASLRKSLIESGPAVQIPNFDRFEVTDNEFVFRNLDEVFGIPSDEEKELLDDTKGDGTLASLKEALLRVQAYRDSIEKTVPDKSGESDSSGIGSAGEPIPFQDDDGSLRDALNDVFESIGRLEGAPLDALHISDRIDAAVHRCIQQAYGYTGNKASKIPGYVKVLSEFETSDNLRKQELYGRIKEICDYVINYDITLHNLNPTYERLRLSQMIPNYFLKRNGYVMDASACSSGKTGTILLAPVETQSKVSVVLVENNTYETILGEFNTWYSTRKDYAIIPKEDFWPDSIYDWTKEGRNVIIILDKAFVSRIDDKQLKESGAETFASLISRSGIELLVADEVHNYKGKDTNEGFKVVEEGSKETDSSHSNCSRCTHTMAVHSKYRLFSSATPLLNDLQEPARILSMLLPGTNFTYDKNHRHQTALRQVTDSPSTVDGIFETTSVIYTPLHANATRVPKPDIEYDLDIVSNEGLSIINGKLRRNKNTWMKSWTSYMRGLIDDLNGEWNDQNQSKNLYWSDQKQDEIHFDAYLILLEQQIVDALKNGKQICFYTNNSMQTHEELKDRILEVARKHKLRLDSSEVVVANGTTSSQLRKPVDVAELGIRRPKLIDQVWRKQCKVLIANEVIEVGLDGLQGTDKIQDCGRISVVFLLANPYTDAAKYQLFSRFVRTQGSDTDQLPEVKFYQPMVFWDSSLEDDDANCYARNESTNRRLMRKKLRSDLLLDGVFPEGIDLKMLKQEVPKLIYKQLDNGTFGTPEGQAELEDKAIESVEGR